jgi:hypothetical protein
MRVLNTEQLLCCDVDGTLLMWGTEWCNDREKRAFFTDPYNGNVATVNINTANLKIVRDRLARGATIMVWSQSGWQWAKACVEALGLEDEEKVVVTTKPLAYIDDKTCEKWMGDHINLDMNDAYGVK